VGVPDEVDEFVALVAADVVAVEAELGGLPKLSALCHVMT
jgi:hypothetical protein